MKGRGLRKVSSNINSNSFVNPVAYLPLTPVFDARKQQLTPYAAGPANLIISAGLQPSLATEADFNAWYTKEHMPLVSKTPGYVRTRRYKLVGATNLNEYNRQQSDAPSYLALHEFDSNSFPNAELRKCDETPWSVQVFKGLEKLEVGFYRRKRVYKEGEQPTSKL